MQILNKFSLREKLLILFLFLGAIASLFIFFQYKSTAFPEYNIKFDITREEAVQKSENFLQDLGFNAEDYYDAAIFDIDNTAKTYLERETTVENVSRLAENQIDLWRFVTRFFEPQQKEEFSVAFMPNGRLSGFNWVIEDDRRINSLDADEAQVRAEKFLEEYTIFNPDTLILSDTQTITQKNRVDHVFTWEKEDLQTKDAVYQIRVGTYGDRIGEYSEFLKVPEAWAREFEKERSNNQLAQQIAETIFILFFGISLIAVFIQGFKKRKLRYKAGFIVAFIIAIVELITALNSFPLILFQYDTTQSWYAFLVSILIISITGSVVSGGMNFLIITAGEYVYREVYPKKLKLEYIFSKGLRTREASKALLVGSLTGIITIAYVTAFYIIGERFGVWTPVDTNYSDIFSTLFPAIYPLYIGLIAAVYEEGVFRLFGISFLKKIFKNIWVPIIITAFAWSFLHSNYPQSPWFIRGLEVGFNGIVLGIIFHRYGIIASIASHYIYNALLTAFFITSGANLFNSVSSITLALLPLIILLLIYTFKTRKLGFVTNLYPLSNAKKINEVKKPPDKIKEYQAKHIYKPITKKVIASLIIAAVISLLLIRIIPDPTINPVPTKITKAQAEEIARDYLVENEIDISRYRTVTSYTLNTPDLLVQEYIIEKTEASLLQRIYPEKIPLSYWVVRYYSPLQKEEVLVYILPDGNLYKVKKILSEESPAADLSQENARQIAQNYLQENTDTDINRLELVDSAMKKQINRTDYNFTYINETLDISDAELRTDLEIKGNEVTDFNKFIKLPEDWVRDRQETNLLNLAINTTLLIAFSILIVQGLLTFLDLIRSNRIKFKTTAAIILPLIAGAILSKLNQYPVFFSTYDTSIPLTSFITQQLITISIEIVLLFLFLTALLGMFLAMWRLKVGNLLPQQKGLYIRDGIILSYTVPIILFAIGQSINYLSTIFDIGFPPIDPFYLPEINTIFPAFSEFYSAILSLFIIPGIIIALFLLQQLTKDTRKFILVIIFLITLLSLNISDLNGEDLYLSVILILLRITIFSAIFFSIYYFIKKISGTNLIAYIGIVYVNFLVYISLQYVMQDNIFFKLNGFILLIMIIIPLLIYIMYYFRKKLFS